MDTAVHAVPTVFGDYVQTLRKQRRIGFGEMVKRTGLDAGNYSKLERNLMPAPKDGEKLARIWGALGLEEGHPEQRELIRLADLSRGSIPRTILSNQEIVGKLPALFRQIDEGGMGEAELDVLIDKIRETHAGEPEGEAAWRSK